MKTKIFLREINHEESYITGDGENSLGTRHTRWKSGPIRQTKCIRKINKKGFFFPTTASSKTSGLLFCISPQVEHNICWINIQTQQLKLKFQALCVKVSELGKKEDGSMVSVFRKASMPSDTPYLKTKANKQTSFQTPIIYQLFHHLFFSCILHPNHSLPFIHFPQWLPTITSSTLPYILLSCFSSENSSPSAREINQIKQTNYNKTRHTSLHQGWLRQSRRRKRDLRASKESYI